MLAASDPDRIDIAFDDDRLVDHAGLLLPATLAGRLGLRELADAHLDLGDAPGRANAGDKLLTLVASALAGGDCIDDADALRAGGTASVLGLHGQGAVHPRAPSCAASAGATSASSTASAAHCSPAPGRTERDRRRAVHDRPRLDDL